MKYCERPLVVRCGAFGDMVLLTAMIRSLHARFALPVDVLCSGPWSVPLLEGQPGVGEVMSVRSRKTPYWLAPDQRRVVRRLRERGVGPTWFCDANQAARPMLIRAGFTDEFIVDVRDHPLLPGEHSTEQWRRLAAIMPARVGPPGVGFNPARPYADPVPGCHLVVSEEQRQELHRWLRTRSLADDPLILIQVGNKRTMRRGLRRLAVNHKYWPNERWAEVIRFLRGRHPSHRIVMLGTGPEHALNEQVAALAGVDRVHNAADDLTVPRVVALLERGTGLLTVDSGPAHAAAAVGCPEVVLFGKALPSLYRPYGSAGADVKILQGQIDGEPSMLGILPADVIAAWSTLALRA